ncbi:MAG: caspase family protein [Kofleriaceae bacterium]
MLRIALLLTLLGGIARADDIANYAIVVGSNAGGPGQASLRYAEDDAHRVAKVLTELGGYPADHVDVVLHPTPGDLRDHLATLAARVKQDTAAGKQARVFFYYSGHARAQAIDLGQTELPLDELREKLFAVPATLTVVVLDACQSGAFSRVKGATPAADFSFSSRQRLDASGVAVLASSSGSELSQESEQLKSSYFTHHLLVGLRGAGDANGDGEVTIDEAYRYAYHQTLLATAETAVGGQHVTFEAELKGHGDVALSYPRAATSQITLPARMEGKTLVEDRRAHVVVAETYKAKGAAVRIAVAPGDYNVLVRHGNALSRCPLAAPGEVDLDHCTDEALAAEATKGGDGPKSFYAGHYRFTLTAAIGSDRDDDYTKNLQAFGYTRDAGAAMNLEATMTHGIWDDDMFLGGSLGVNALQPWTHDIVGSDATQHLEMQTFSLRGVAGRQDQLTRWLSWYYQVGFGLAVGHTLLHGADSMSYSTTNLGPTLAGEYGIRFALPQHLVLGLVGNYSWEWAIKDLIGNTHASGGFRLGLTLGWNL